MEVKLRLNEKQHGAFYLMEGEERLGEMVIGISGDDLTVYHTEIFPQGEGKGLGKKLLEAMVEYVRQHNMKVIALCPYVHAQFSRHPEAYADIWKQTV
jgi:predicted GNAT family acetyltransferase